MLPHQSSEALMSFSSSANSSRAWADLLFIHFKVLLMIKVSDKGLFPTDSSIDSDPRYFCTYCLPLQRERRTTTVEVIQSCWRLFVLMKW